MSEAPSTIYAGLSQVTFEGEPFDFGYGVTLKSTYAHLFGPNMMAFARAAEGKPHPAPWRAARGGFGYDVEVELAVPTNTKLPAGLSSNDVVWLIAALLRLAQYTYLMVPVISDMAFEAAKDSDREPLLRPFETEPRLFQVPDSSNAYLTAEHLTWVKAVWPRTAKLMQKRPELNMALRAADACTVSGRPASGLLMVWGALEELFAPSRSELRFRVSANIAAYLEPVGSGRLKLFKTVAELYNERSKAAHTARGTKVETLVQSFVVLRNALVRMIDDGEVPTQASLQSQLFCGKA